MPPFDPPSLRPHKCQITAAATAAARASTSLPSGAARAPSSPRRPIHGGSDMWRARSRSRVACTRRARHSRDRPSRRIAAPRKHHHPSQGRTSTRHARTRHERRSCGRTLGAGTIRPANRPRKRTRRVSRCTRRVHCSCACIDRQRDKPKRPLDLSKRARRCPRTHTRPRGTSRGRRTEPRRALRRGTCGARTRRHSIQHRTRTCRSSDRTCRGCCNRSRTAPTARMPDRQSQPRICTRPASPLRTRHAHCSCRGTAASCSRLRPIPLRTRTHGAPHRTCHVGRNPAPRRHPRAAPPLVTWQARRAAFQRWHAAAALGARAHPRGT